MNPVERLALHLRLHHPYLTINDVHLHFKQGYLRVRKTGDIINIQRAGYGKISANGKYISINQLWNELTTYYNAHVDITKFRKKSGKATVIQWQGSLYSFDKNIRKKDGSHGNGSQ